MYINLASFDFNFSLSMMTQHIILYEKITENGFCPTKFSKLAAGYDLYSAYDYIVPKRGKNLIKTDIRVAIPKGCYGRIAPRSGLAWKHAIDVGAGVIDCDYRGNVAVILFNHSDKDFIISRGDRIAQLIPEMIADTEMIETKLNSTERGDNGFGSTGN
jgi:dUTP pyrophosphatase